MDTSGGVLAKALYDYQGNGPGELTIKSGDVVSLHWRLDDNWYYGEIKGNGGLLPINAVQILAEQIQPVPLCRALYDFDLTRLEPGERRECLAFMKGDIISVIKRVDEHWAEGRLGDESGIFPLQFTEPNPAALKLLARGNTSDTAEIRPRNARVTSRRANINTASHRHISKRQTSTARPPDVGILNTLNHRQIHSSSTPSAPGKLPRHFSASKLRSGSTHRSFVKGERKMNGEAPPTITMALINPQVPPLLPESKQSTQQLSISVCAALYSYTPHHAQELELSKGEMVGVYGKFKDGWLRGLSLRTGKVGILPANYVTPVLRTSARFLEHPKPSVSSVNSMTPRRYPPQNLRTVQTLDKVMAEGTSAAPVGAMSSQPAVTSTGAVRGSQAGGKQGWDTVKQAFPTSHRGSPRRHLSLQPPAQDLGQIYGFGRSPVLPRKRNGLFSNPIRPHLWTSEGTTPSGGTHHTSDAKYSATKDISTAPHSILVKPDPYRLNQEKPLKSVRFVNEDAPQTMTRGASLSSETQITGSSPSSSAALEHWNPSAIIGRDGNISVLKDTKATLQRKGPFQNFSIGDCLPSSGKSATLNSQPSPIKHRVLKGYNAQTNAEITLLEGEVVLVRKPRPDGRVLVTHEFSGITGLFQSSILDILDKVV